MSCAALVWRRGRPCEGDAQLYRGNVETPGRCARKVRDGVAYCKQHRARLATAHRISNLPDGDVVMCSWCGYMALRPTPSVWRNRDGVLECPSCATAVDALPQLPHVHAVTDNPGKP